MFFLTLSFWWVSLGLWEKHFERIGWFGIKIYLQKPLCFLRNVSEHDCWSFSETKRLLTLLQEWLALNTPPGEDHPRVTCIPVPFKAAFNCFCIELYSRACIHQKLKSNVTFSSFTKSTSFRCHSTQKSGNQENAEWFFIMCWKMPAGWKCQSKREQKWREIGNNEKKANYLPGGS